MYCCKTLLITPFKQIFENFRNQLLKWYRWTRVMQLLYKHSKQDVFKRQPGTWQWNKVACIPGDNPCGTCKGSDQGWLKASILNRSYTFLARYELQGKQTPHLRNLISSFLASLSVTIFEVVTLTSTPSTMNLRVFFRVFFCRFDSFNVTETFQGFYTRWHTTKEHEMYTTLPEVRWKCLPWFWTGSWRWTD